MSARARWAMLLGGLVAAAASNGCGNLTAVLNPDFVASLGGTGSAALPGEANALAVYIENRTGNTVQATISYRDADGLAQTYTVLLSAGDKTGQALVCPVSELTLGDIADTTAPGALVRLGLGTEDDAFIEVEPFGVIMREGINFDCGDAITFTVQGSGATNSGFQIFAFIQRAGGN